MEPFQLVVSVALYVVLPYCTAATVRSSPRVKGNHEVDTGHETLGTGQEYEEVELLGLE